MPLRFTQEPGRVTAYLSGEIDHQVAREMMLALDREVALRAPARLQVDMSEVTFMDSSGIAVLLRALRQMEQIGGALRVTSIPTQARRVLDAAGVGRLITLD